jgi:hypothetical protein
VIFVFSRECNCRVNARQFFADFLKQRVARFALVPNFILQRPHFVLQHLHGED